MIKVRVSRIKLGNQIMLPVAQVSKLPDFIELEGEVVEEKIKRHYDGAVCDCKEFKNLPPLPEEIRGDEIATAFPNNVSYAINAIIQYLKARQ